jgi:hypothetical protein
VAEAEHGAADGGVARRGVAVDVDPQDLAAQVVRVAGAAARIEAGVEAGTVVHRRISVGPRRAGRGVVARRQQHVAVLVERDVTGHVTALAALHLDLDDDLLGREVERARLGVPLEAAELVVALPLVPVARVRAGGQRVRRRAGGRRGGIGRRHRARRVVEVDPAVLLEIGIEGDRLEPVLRVGVDVDRVHGRRRALRGIGQSHLTVARRVEHARVGKHGEVDRLADVLGQRDLLVVGPGGGRDLVSVVVALVGEGGGTHRERTHREEPAERECAQAEPACGHGGSPW